MRVSTTDYFRQATQGLLDQQAKLSEQQFRLASGRSILSPSDDPIGSAQLVDINNALQAINQFTRNAGQAQTRLGVTEEALASVTENLQRVRELTVAGANGTQTNETRLSISKEISQRLDDLLNIANTRDANGEYVFAGNQTAVEPFRFDSSATGGVRYDGDDGRRLVSIDASRQVLINESGRAIFMANDEGNGTFATARVADSAIRSTSTTATAAFDAVDSGVNEPYRIVFFDSASLTATSGDADVYDVQVKRDLDGDGVTEWVTTFTDTAGDGIPDTYAAYSSGVSLTGLPVTITDDTDLPQAGDIVYVDPPTRGAAAISPGQVTDPGAYERDNYTLIFDASDPDAITFDVLDGSGSAVASNVAFEPDGNGRTINAIPGIKFDISGTPEDGDSFSIDPAGRRSVFQTYAELIQILETPQTDNEDGAAFRERIDRVLINLDQSVGTVIEARADTGGRLRVVDDQVTLNADRELQYEGARSRIEDLDYAEAITQLQLQITAFQAAQQSFIRIQGLTLFDLIG